MKRKALSLLRWSLSLLGRLILWLDNVISAMVVTLAIVFLYLWWSGHIVIAKISDHLFLFHIN